MADGPNVQYVKQLIAEGRILGTFARGEMLAQALADDIAAGHRSTPVAAGRRSRDPGIATDDDYGRLFGADGTEPGAAHAAHAAEAARVASLSDDELYRLVCEPVDAHRRFVRPRDARAAAAHEAYDGEHTHPHSDTNGGEHTHPHVHLGDANHTGQQHTSVNPEQQRLHEMGD